MEERDREKKVHLRFGRPAVYGLFRRLDGINEVKTDDASNLSIDQPLSAQRELRSTNESGNRHGFKEFLMGQ